MKRLPATAGLVDLLPRVYRDEGGGLLALVLEVLEARVQKLEDALRGAPERVADRVAAAGQTRPPSTLDGTADGLCESLGGAVERARLWPSVCVVSAGEGWLEVERADAAVVLAWDRSAAARSGGAGSLPEGFCPEGAGQDGARLDGAPLGVKVQVVRVDRGRAPRRAWAGLRLRGEILAEVESACRSGAKSPSAPLGDQAP
jgi:hypothetical protein